MLSLLYMLINIEGLMNSLKNTILIFANEEGNSQRLISASFQTMLLESFSETLSEELPIKTSISNNLGK